MAELANNSKTTGKKERRSIRNRPMPKVDLTAMVDLAFLLITFFMLTTSLSTPNKLDVAMPDRDKGLSTPINISEDRTLNLLLGGNNELTYYLGASESPKTAPQRVAYGKLGLGELLIQMKNKIKMSSNGQDIIVLIKPSDIAVTRNVVDVLDAVQRASIKRFMVTKINELEKKML
ncbi:ExbD/TolR family protein [Sphingobacterium sp. LRF_L2]|uniref:ExbD/TolR family protein n=1 Tax=Sphingobacterium sp. LRF_L2 TaxID=3369421 RepID=UPI003F611360